MEIPSATPPDSTAFSNLADLTIPENQSGRRQLAEWLASPENPLTARVFVNRVWLHLIGEGLVRTPDNFGFAGQRPTHPKLLDYLAHRFSGEDHWSVKRLIRRIVTSRVYRLSSDVRKPLAAADPENRLLTHAFRRRLDAEALRDAMLKISGRLTSDRRRGPIFSDIGQYDSSYDHDRFSTQLRSVHVPAFRNARLEFFEVFDGANPNVVTGRRNRSTLPSQALYLLNSPFVADQAKWAARQFPAAGKGSSAATDDMIEEAFLTVIARPPTVSERIAVLNHLQTSGADSEESASGDAWTAVIHSLFASIDFRYLD